MGGDSAGLGGGGGRVAGGAGLAGVHDAGLAGGCVLLGRVLPVCGHKGEVLGANRAGIKDIIIPKGNEADVEDVPEEVRNTLEFHPVETLSEVLRIALVPAEQGESARPLEMKEVA